MGSSASNLSDAAVLCRPAAAERRFIFDTPRVTAGSFPLMSQLASRDRIQRKPGSPLRRQLAVTNAKKQSQKLLTQGICSSQVLTS